MHKICRFYLQLFRWNLSGCKILKWITDHMNRATPLSEMVSRRKANNWMTWYSQACKHIKFDDSRDISRGVSGGWPALYRTTGSTNNWTINFSDVGTVARSVSHSWATCYNDNIAIMSVFSSWSLLASLTQLWQLMLCMLQNWELSLATAAEAAAVVVQYNTIQYNIISLNKLWGQNLTKWNVVVITNQQRLA